jgi:hypothetical protein
MCDLMFHKITRLSFINAPISYLLFLQRQQCARVKSHIYIFCTKWDHALWEAANRSLDLTIDNKFNKQQFAKLNRASMLQRRDGKARSMSVTIIIIIK